MIKTVNVNARIPVRNVTPTIKGYHAGLKMSTEDILKCLSRRATVDEVLSNGKIIRLTMRNYYLDNESTHEQTEGSALKTEEAPIVAAVEAVMNEEIATDAAEETVEDVTETVEETVEEEESLVLSDEVVEDTTEEEESSDDDTDEKVEESTSETARRTSRRSNKRR